MSGIKVTINGDIDTNVETYTVTEDSTPVDPSDSFGGVGQFTFSIDDTADVRRKLHEAAELSDQGQGSTVGNIRGLNSVSGTVTATADSRMALLAVERTAQPYVGTLGGAWTYYCSLFGITTGIVVDDTIAGSAVVFQGWTGNGWDYLKQMAISQGAEMSLVSNNVVLRPTRGRLAQDYRDASVDWSIDETDMARAIEIYYYQNTYSASGLIYPSGGWSEDVPVLTVEAGATETFDIPLTVSLESIVQPTCVSFVDRYEASSSVYSVVGTGTGSDLPIPPAEWAAGGGSVTVAINPDTTSITVTVKGSYDTQYAPYRIAMTAGPSDTYSSLRIMGGGVFTDKQKLRMDTNVDPDQTSQEIGATVDNVFISTLEQAYHLGFWAVKRWGSPRMNITVSTTGINRLGETGSYAYPTIADFNALYAGMDIGDFNAIWAGQTIDDFNEFMRLLAQSDFANQAFGNVAGARRRFGDSIYRIRNVSISPELIRYTAEDDTTLADFNDVWAGATVEDFNAEWLGETFADFQLAPLRRTDWTLYPANDLYPANGLLAG